MSKKRKKEKRELDVSALPTLPPGWCWATVEQLGSPNEQPVLTGPFGSTLGRSDFVDQGVPLLTIGCLTEQGVTLDKAFYVTEEKANDLGRYRVREGDLLFSRSASVGRAGYVTLALEGSVINYHLMRLRLADEIMRPQTFIYYVRGSETVRRYLREVNHGATRDGINTTDLLGMPVAVPPAAEQKRFTDKIEELFSDLDAGVAALERARANLKRYRAAVLKAAVEGKLTEEWRAENPHKETAAKLLERILKERRKRWEEDQLAAYEAKGKKPPKNWRDRYKEPAGPDTANLPELPEGWCWATPVQLAASQPYALAIGPFGSNLKVSDYTDSGVPLVFVRNIRSGNFGGASTKHVSEGKATELTAHAVDPGDVLITKMGDPPGDACLYPLEQPRAIITADCIKFRPSEILTHRTFFVWAINSNTVHRQIMNITRGVAQKKVSLSRFSGISLPLPPLEEQERIVAEIEQRLSIADATVRQINVNALRAARLRQSILKRAFEGKLVPQDPTDEPANELLASLKSANSK